MWLTVLDEERKKCMYNDLEFFILEFHRSGERKVKKIRSVEAK